MHNGTKANTKAINKNKIKFVKYCRHFVSMIYKTNSFHFSTGLVKSQ